MSSDKTISQKCAAVSNFIGAPLKCVFENAHDGPHADDFDGRLWFWGDNYGW